MENKKSFLLYADIIHTVNKLPNEKAGELFKLILDYVNDNDPETEDLILQIAFEPIKQNLKRDLQKWKNISDRNRENGKKGGRPKKTKITQSDNLEPKKADNVNVNDNDNDNVKIIDSQELEIFFNTIQGNFNNLFQKRTRVFPMKIKKRYLNLIKDGFTLDDITNAMKNAAADDYHKGTNFKYCTLEFFSRCDKIDKFANQSSQTKKYIPTR
jgi:ATP-dependent protease HslVU (ClpYQ) ATPase subunit